MRTNVEINDGLLKEAQKLTGLRTKRAVVDAALRMLVRVHHQQDILKLAGKVDFWDEVIRDRDENRLDK
jgi:Arc/MetJ family transcription regulator